MARGDAYQDFIVVAAPQVDVLLAVARDLCAGAERLAEGFESEALGILPALGRSGDPATEEALARSDGGVTEGPPKAMTTQRSVFWYLVRSGLRLWLTRCRLRIGRIFGVGRARRAEARRRAGAEAPQMEPPPTLHIDEAAEIGRPFTWSAAEAAHALPPTEIRISAIAERPDWTLVETREIVSGVSPWPTASRSGFRAPISIFSAEAGQRRRSRTSTSTSIATARASAVCSPISHGPTGWRPLPGGRTSTRSTPSCPSRPRTSTPTEGRAVA